MIFSTLIYFNKLYVALTFAPSWIVSWIFQIDSFPFTLMCWYQHFSKKIYLYFTTYFLNNGQSGLSFTTYIYHLVSFKWWNELITNLIFNSDSMDIIGPLSITVNFYPAVLFFNATHLPFSELTLWSLLVDNFSLFPIVFHPLIFQFYLID